MPSRTPIPDEINNHNFEALYRKEPHARTRIRYLCMSHIQAGKSFSEIAQMLKVSRETIRIWVKRFAEEGLTGLCERPGRGAKQRLSPRDEPVFKKAVEALQAERAGGRVTGHDIRDLLTDVTHPLNNVLYSQDVAPRMGFVIPLTLQIMVVD